MAARRVLTANQAGLRTATNDALLQIAQVYFDLQAATGRLAIAREATANAEALSAITKLLCQARDWAWRPTIAVH